MSMKTVLVVILLFMVVMIGGCEDKTEACADPVAVAGENGTPCDPDDFCRVERDENGDMMVYICKVHEPEPIVFDASDVTYDVIEIGTEPHDSSAIYGPSNAVGVPYSDLVIDADTAMAPDIEFDVETPVIDFDTWVGQAETVEIDPNDYLIWLTEDWDIPDTLTIGTESGGELVLSFEGDELKITGDADMNEAAQIFFTEILKRIVDDYIRSRTQ